MNTPPCFAGYCDWRLPTSAGSTDSPTGQAAELESILWDESFDTNCGPNSGGNTGCTVDGAGGTPVCSCTVRDFYWSGSTYSAVPVNAWEVSFKLGYATPFGKSFDGYVRAVRGGV